MSPLDIVERYSQEKYDLISITDHEVTDGIAEAVEAGKDKNLRVIPGIEIATVCRGIELHILGYYFDADDQKLKDQLRLLAQERRRRNKRLLAVLQDMGIDIDEADLIKGRCV